MSSPVRRFTLRSHAFVPTPCVPLSLLVLVFVVVLGVLGPRPVGAALVIGLELSPVPARPGEQLTVEITVSNTDAFARTGVVAELVLPAGLEDFNRVLVTGPFSSGACTQLGGAGICSVGETILWSLGTLEAGQSRTLTLPPIVAAVADGTNIAFSPSAVDSDNIVIVANDTTTVASARVLEVAIDEVVQPVAAGGRLAYLLHYGNASTTTAATDATLRLPLPAGTSFVSASDGGGLVGSTIEWSLGTLAPGASGQREVELLAPIGPRGTLIAANATLEDTAGQVRSSSISEIDGGEALVVGLEVATDPARTGEQLAVEATVTNRDVTAHTGVTVLLRLPQGLDDFNRVLVTGPFTSGACTQLGGSGVCSAGEVVSWSLGTLEAGQSETLTLPPLVASVVDGSLVQLRAVVDGSGSDDRAAASRTIAVEDGRFLEAAIDERLQPVASGGRLDYRLHFGNASMSSAASNALLRLPLPEGASFVAASDGGALVGDAVEWSLGSLAPGASGRRDLELSTSSLPDGALLHAEATLSSDGGEARARAVTEIDGGEALALGLEVGPEPVRPGEALHVELTITNRDVVAHTGVSVRLRLPDGIDDFNRVLVTGPFTSGACTQLGGSGTCSSGEFVSWSLGTLEAGQSETLTLVPILSALDDGTLTGFRAELDGSGADDRASASRTLATLAGRRLELAVEESANPGAAGAILGHTLHWANRSGSEPLSNATLRLELPLEATFVSASDGGALVGSGVEWSLGTIPAQGYGERSVVALVDGGVVDGALLRAEATLRTDSERIVQESIGEVDGDETLDVDLEIVEPPGGLRFVRATVHNTDVVDRSGVVLRMRLAEGMADFDRVGISGPFTSGSCSQLGGAGVCSSGEAVFWSFGTIGAGASTTVTLPPTFGTAPDGSLATFRAIVVDDTDDARAAASLPEPGGLATWLGGVGLLVALGRRRRRRDPRGGSVDPARDARRAGPPRGCPAP